MTYDLLVKNARVVRPGTAEPELLDIGIQSGQFAKIAPAIPASEANVGSRNQAQQWNISRGDRIAEAVTEAKNAKLRAIVGGQQNISD